MEGPMSVKLALSLISIIMLIGGIVFMKVIFASQAAGTRKITLFDALAGTQWLRDDRGRFRWVVVGWTGFWLAMCFVAAGLR